LSLVVEGCDDKEDPYKYNLDCYDSTQRIVVRRQPSRPTKKKPLLPLPQPVLASPSVEESECFQSQSREKVVAMPKTGQQQKNRNCLTKGYRM
jgi:hypothetical protein